MIRAGVKAIIFAVLAGVINYLEAQRDAIC
jgi:hypothetical protein